MVPAIVLTLPLVVFDIEQKSQQEVLRWESGCSKLEGDMDMCFPQNSAAGITLLMGVMYSQIF